MCAAHRVCCGPMTALPTGVRLRYSWTDSPAQTGAELDNDLFELLRAVHSSGSIMHASKVLGASYRHVWGALKRWEQQLGQPVLTWTQGQPSRLTPFAERLLWAETRARARLTPHIEALRSELVRVVQEAVEGDQALLTLYASHDVALPSLCELARASQQLHVGLHFCGSVDALQALAEGRCLVAGFHVPVRAAAAARFEADLKARLQPGEHKLISCMRRGQGLMVARGNPLGIRGVGDLMRPGMRVINRQPGSGTRLLFEQLLDDAGLQDRCAPGWLAEPEHSHLAVAAGVASGTADAGCGIEAAARAFQLDFVPLAQEDYHLVCLKQTLELPAMQRLRAVLSSAAWAGVVQALPGYAPAPAVGEVLPLTKALPWWVFAKSPK